MGVVYNTETVQLVEEQAVGVSSVQGQPRQEVRYQFRPLGTSGAYDFYLYNGYYKAGNDSTSRNRRLTEALAVREDADDLGAGAQIIYAGDSTRTPVLRRVIRPSSLPATARRSTRSTGPEPGTATRRSRISTIRPRQSMPRRGCLAAV